MAERALGDGQRRKAGAQGWAPESFCFARPKVPEETTFHLAKENPEGGLPGRVSGCPCVDDCRCYNASPLRACLILLGRNAIGRSTASTLGQRASWRRAIAGRIWRYADRLLAVRASERPLEGHSHTHQSSPGRSVARKVELNPEQRSDVPTLRASIHEGRGPSLKDGLRPEPRSIANHGPFAER
jgi:hypothetical protein